MQLSPCFCQRRLWLPPREYQVIPNPETPDRRRQAVFEVFGPNGRAGCTRPMPEAESNNAQNKLIDLIWHMAFDGEGK